MASRPPVPPITNQFPIVDGGGRPTDYFIRWLQERGFEIDGLLTPLQVLQIVEEWSAARFVNTNLPLVGGGALSTDLTLDHGPSGVTPGTYGNATNVAQVTVDDEGHVTGVANVPISGGGGGSSFVVPYTPRVIISGRYYAPNGRRFGTGTGNVAGLNTMFAHPFSASMSIAGISMENTGTAAQNVQFALYTAHPTTNLPYQLIEASGNISLAAAGIKTFTLSSPYAATGLVWLCRNKDSNTNVAFRISAGLSDIGSSIFGATSLNTTSDPYAMSAAQTYGTWPADVTSLSWTPISDATSMAAVAA